MSDVAVSVSTEWRLSGRSVAATGFVVRASGPVVRSTLVLRCAVYITWRAIKVRGRAARNVAMSTATRCTSTTAPMSSTLSGWMSVWTTARRRVRIAARSSSSAKVAMPYNLTASISAPSVTEGSGENAVVYGAARCRVAIR